MIAFEVGDALIVATFSWQERNVGAGDWSVLEAEIVDEGDTKAKLQKLSYKFWRTRVFQF